MVAFLLMPAAVRSASQSADTTAALSTARSKQTEADKSAQTNVESTRTSADTPPADGRPAQSPADTTAPSAFPSGPASAAITGQALPRYEFVEDGEPTTKLHIPCYEWFPPGRKPTCLVLAIHGLTLHGRRYELLGKVAATGGYYFVAPDMRGYGKCRFDKSDKYCSGKDCRHKIDYEKSTEDLAAVGAYMKQLFPGVPLLIVGESLGATMALKLAGEHPELADGIILSSPAAKVHPLMYVYPDNIIEGAAAVLLRPKGEVKLNAFMRKLVSCNPKVGQELIDDPLVAKELTIGELLTSDSFVHKTLKYARQVKEGTPVLILAASKDHCVRPDAVTQITQNIKSANQTIRWLDHLDHLLLESDFIRAATVDSLTDWSDDQAEDRQKELAEIHKLMLELGDKSTD